MKGEYRMHAEPMSAPVAIADLRIHLASQSPRRRAIIAWLGIPAEATAVDVPEIPLLGESPPAMARRLAFAKLAAASTPASSSPFLVIAADTVVDLAGRALGKPESADEATQMLRDLRSAPHQVHTAIAIRDSGEGQSLARCVTTQVVMRPYSDAEIATYVASGDPMDKAGAYAIQHPTFHPVLRVDRCYANVVGLPICALAVMLAALGIQLDIAIPELCHTHFGYRCPAPDPGYAVE